MKTAFLGATRGMGRALARRMAERGDRLFLLGRNPEELERSARDLEVRAGVERGSVGHARCDLEEPGTFGPALDAAAAKLGGLDTVVVTAGLFASQDEMEADLERARRVLDVDFTATVLFCEEARRRLITNAQPIPDEGQGRDGKVRRGKVRKGDGKKLCVFSSVAGERGRKPVVLYGAAKAGLTRYLEGLDHRYHARGLEVITVKPGFVKTGMTAGLDPPPFAGEPEGVARRVLAAIDRGRPVVYAPGAWRWVMAVIRALPRAVMRRVGF